jgi:hypothetical protein
VYTWATQKSSRRNFFGATEIQETKNEWMKNEINSVFYYQHHGCSFRTEEFRSEHKCTVNVFWVHFIRLLIRAV